MKKWLTFFLVVVAFATQMLVVIPSGTRMCDEQNRCGDYYWGAHEHDGIWHLALAKVAFSTWPPQMPTYAGGQLTGYNWLMDYPIYLLDKIGIDAKITYFKILPILWFGLMVWAWKKFARAYNPVDSYYLWLITLLFFGNSLSFLLTWWHKGSWEGASGLLAMQSPQMLTNIQFAYTLPLFAMAGFFMLKNKEGKRDSLWLSLIVFLSMGLKFYGGVIALLWIGVNALFYGNWKRLLTIGIGFLAATGLFYRPNLVGGDSIFSIRPLATVFPIIEEKELYYLPKLAEWHYAVGDFAYIKMLIAGLIALTIFLIFNYGARLVGLFSIRKPSIFERSLLIMIGIATVANIFLVQRGEWWNTVQFLYYGLIFMSILAAKSLAQSRNSAFGIIVGLSLIPNLLDTVRIFSTRIPGTIINEKEIAILKELAKQPKGTVLALPLAETAYVAAYSEMPTYISDRVQSRLVGIDYRQREEHIKNEDCGILDEVDYLYLAGDKTQLQNWEKCNTNFYLISENDAAILYRLD